MKYMWINLKILLNQLSLREFVLFVIFIFSIFAYLLYYFLFPKLEILKTNNKLLELQSKSFEQYSKAYGSKKNILNDIFAQEQQNKKQSLSSSSKTNKNIDINKTFKSKTKFLLWLCENENKIFISKLVLKHTDIKNTIKVGLNGYSENMEQKICSFKNIFSKNISLSDIFYNETYKIISIIGDKVKLNEKWYKKNAQISENILLKGIKGSHIIILQDSKIREVFLGEKF